MSTKSPKIILGYNIAKAPLYYVRSGLAFLQVGHLGGVGVSGYNWSLLTLPILSDAYGLDILTDRITPAGEHNRWAGYPLRCLKLFTIYN